MKTVAEGLAKWVASYLTVVFVIMFLPVFLLTNDFEVFDRIVNYLFSNKLYD